MPPKDTKKKPAKSANPKSKTPGPELQPKEYVFNHFAIHRLPSFEWTKNNQVLYLGINKTVNLLQRKWISQRVIRRPAPAVSCSKRLT